MASPESGPEAVRPLHLHVPDEELADLRERLLRTRLPEAETVRGSDGGADWSQGPPLEVVSAWVRYWAHEHDWRRVEGELNAAGQAVTEVDGLDVHFLHVRSPRPDARPLVITHGWPSSVLEPLAVVGALTDPADPAAPAFHVVAPSLPGYALSGKPQETGWTFERTADAWAVLMARLGYERFFAAGGDWGGRVTVALATRHPERVAGLHTFTPYVPEPEGGVQVLGRLTEVEERWVAQTRRFWEEGSGYSRLQSTRPQTVAYALVDSPVALLAWLLEKFWAWTDHAGDLEDAVSRDRVLDTVTLYWLTRSGGSSVRFYWQNSPPARSEPVTTPSAISVFPADIEKLPRRWVETRFTDVRRWSEPARGGHFPMLEVPDAYAQELRDALGPMPL